MYFCVLVLGDEQDFERGSRWLFWALFFGVWSLYRLVLIVAGTKPVRDTNEDILRIFEDDDGHEREDIDVAFEGTSGSGGTREELRSERHERVLPRALAERTMVRREPPTAPQAPQRIGQRASSAPPQSDLPWEESIRIPGL